MIKIHCVQPTINYWYTNCFIDRKTIMKFATLLIKSGLTVASAGLYLLARKFFRKVKRTTENVIEKAEDKPERKPKLEQPQNNVNIPIAYV